MHRIIPFLALALLILLCCSTSAQRISYSITDADPEKYTGFLHGTFTTDVNGLYLVGLNLGVRSEVFIANTPVTARTIVNVGVVRAGINTDFSQQEVKRLREIDLGVSYKLLGSSSPRKARMRVILSNDGTTEKYLRGIEGKKLRDVAARASFYHFGAFEMRTTGLTYGISLRNRKHTQIELVNDSDYYYETYRFRQIYADFIFTPRANNPAVEDSGDIKRLGYRAGFVNNYGKASITVEVSLRPGHNQLLPFFSAIYGFGGRW